MRLIGNPKPAVYFHASAFEHVHFLKKSFGVNHHPVPDHANFFRIKNSRRDQMKNKFFPVDLDRMPGIRASLIADNHIAFGGKNINDFPFSFVTPLGTNQYSVQFKDPFINGETGTGGFRRKPLCPLFYFKVLRV
ncbi:MAG: hypothetical protein BWY42_01473 [Candidatus Omnitrophica bacterium ADurb.Bin277]|nr:MAG: hypothetical protein BWY42_01473 [Candidatus Omnitrophica bacterium ADurb.Bin277]